MNKELCFCIEDEELYLEQVLVDYIDIPIFFLCRGKTRYYVALCTDIDELNYYVVRLSDSDVFGLLHGKIIMRDAILKQSEFWDIKSSEDISADIVEKKKIDLIDISLLPEANAYFKVLTESIQLFVRKFDAEIFSQKNFSAGDKKINVKDVLETVTTKPVFECEKQYSELADYKLIKTLISNIPLYMDGLYVDYIADAA